MEKERKIKQHPLTAVIFTALNLQMLGENQLQVATIWAFLHAESQWNQGQIYVHICWEAVANGDVAWNVLNSLATLQLTTSYFLYKWSVDT